MKLEMAILLFLYGYPLEQCQVINCLKWKISLEAYIKQQ